MYCYVSVFPFQISDFFYKSEIILFVCVNVYSMNTIAFE